MIDNLTDNSIIGIIAGRGHLVEQLVTTCEQQNRPFFILAFEGQTDQQLVINRPHVWSKLTRINYNLKLLKQRNITKLIMVGKFNRPSWEEIIPDLKGAQWLASLVGKAFGDDSLIRIIISKLEQEGFTILSPESIIGNHIFIDKAYNNRIKLTEQHLCDIERGRKLLRELSHLDICQAIVIQQGLVLGVEAIEGTDELIKRCSIYKRQGSKPILIKMCKLNQETRLDRATVGLETMHNLIEASFAGMALGANSVIVLDSQEIARYGTINNIFVIGIDEHSELKVEP